MSSRPSKRPAQFDPEERESPKRPRQNDQNGAQRDQKDRTVTNGDRRERNGTHGGDRDRRPTRDEARPYGREDRSERPRETQRRMSPRRQRSRERSQDRGKGAESRMPRTNGTSAPSTRAPNKDTKTGIKKEPAIKTDPIKMEVDDAEDGEVELDQEMMRAMGFAKFKSTKNTKVPGNDKLYAVRKEKQMVARQYMNRPGGFNRPLSPSAQE